MRVRSAVDTDTSSPQDRSPNVTNTDSSRALRTLVLVAAGTVVVAYALDRVLGSSDEDEPSLEAIREQAVDAVPSAVSDRVPDAVPTEPQAIPIGDVGSDESEADTTDEANTTNETGTDTDTSSDASASGAGEPVDDAETNVDLADDPSSTKITSGSSDEIQEKPAEPGELSVDEDVEDVIDEDDVGTDVDADGRSADGADGDSSADDEE
ncbi:hypothetical protein [Natronorubrum texcoconense]|uniref:Uncharacterized protein n=1 Tax=Natronorubrum texcoconense TaxID=1095776 RepID=A0A1G9G0D2_9EURY|nr:hypothetical protein [Natronorubrum texcoconense]SDK94096.1 hypothetical protein SAMN04515672_4367 [Natronorubrum texcoconense]